jgi:hypothetical protein
MPNTKQSPNPNIKKASAFARDFCRMLGPTYDQPRVLAYVRSIFCIGVWFVFLVPMTLYAPLFGGTFLVFFLWMLWDSVRMNREIWSLARRRRSFPLDIRKRLYRDGLALRCWDYWRIIDLPELRELRKAIRTDQLIVFLLIPPLILFASLLSSGASYVTGGMIR